MRGYLTGVLRTYVTTDFQFEFFQSAVHLFVLADRSVLGHLVGLWGLIKKFVTKMGASGLFPNEESWRFASARLEMRSAEAPRHESQK